jgi:hypothetical protein
MNEMVLTERIGFFMVEIKSFCDSCIPYPTEVLQRVHHHLPIVAAKANNLLLIVIKVHDSRNILIALHFVRIDCKREYTLSIITSNYTVFNLGPP